MHEYLAAGLPVISTSLPEARRYAGPIVIADTAEDFAAACDRVLADEAPGRRAAISAAMKNDTWASRVEVLSDAIKARVGARSPGPTRTPEEVPVDLVAAPA